MRLVLYLHQFSKKVMDTLKNLSDNLLQVNDNNDEVDGNVKLVVNKQISANDIRAKILRVT